MTTNRRRGAPMPFDPWGELPWALHREAKEAVAAHPDGMTLEEIGDILGLTRERVRQIEATALKKLRRGRRIPVYSGGVMCSVCYVCGIPQVDGVCVECSSESFTLDSSEYAALPDLEIG
jgi:hypothetical protein